MSIAKHNKHLWFLHKGCSGKHYIIGNPHTFPGRMLGWCVLKRRSFFFSKSDIEESSLEAACWVEGFLTGNEPAPPTNSEGDVDFKGRAYKRWLTHVDAFRNSGVWQAKQSKEKRA